MSALLEDLTLGEDDDIVCISNCAQSVRNHNDSHLLTAIHQQIKSCLDLSFRLWVKCRSSFIKQQNTGVANQSSSNGNSLLLTTRELNSTFANHGLIAFGEQLFVAQEGGNISLPASKFKSLLDLLFCKAFEGTLRPIQNVLTNIAGEESRLLLHNRKLVLMQPLVVEIFHVDVAVEQLTSLGVVETLQ